MDEPQKKKRYEDDGYGTPGLRIGSVVHEYIATRVVTKKSGTVRVRLYRCALCPPADEVLMISTGVERGFHDEGRLAAHLAGHALRADVAHSKAMARECGISAPIPGQTGMAELGVGDVLPKKKRAATAKKPRTKLAAVRSPSGYQTTKSVNVDEEQRSLYEEAMQAKRSSKGDPAHA